MLNVEGESYLEDEGIQNVMEVERNDCWIDNLEELNVHF